MAIHLMRRILWGDFMNCRRARKLIDRGPYSALSDEEARCLEEHLLSCQRCRFYHDKARACLSAIEADARHIDCVAELSIDFGERFRQRLGDTKPRGVVSSQSPSQRLSALLISRNDRLEVFKRVVTTAGAIAVITLALANEFARPVDISDELVTLSRLPALSIRKSPNGRVYASVTLQSAALQPRRWEVLP